MSSEIDYLLSLEAVRERANTVFEAAKRDQLSHFDYHPSRMDEVADYVTSVIKRDFGPNKFNTIPPHGRWQHFEVGNIPRIDTLISEWKGDDGCDDTEVTRRLIDLFMVSVLLDAGAGDTWVFVEEGTGGRYTRSEGIAVASLYMFRDGLFSSWSGNPQVVDGKGLQSIDEDALAKGFQITPQNPMIGVGPRANLLSRLGSSLLSQPEIFGPEGRPGNLVDFVIKSSATSTLDYRRFWSLLQKCLIPIWPKDRTQISGVPIGDAWPLRVLETQNEHSTRANANIQPFHKLTQWLAYSLMVPFTRILSLDWANADLGTGLPEYRNGGLFVDLGVLTLKPEALIRGKRASGQELPMFGASSDEIVEWRAMTVALLDELYGFVGTRMDGLGVKLSMAQMLEAGSWKSGREVAAEKRPQTKSSPILIAGDGTLF